MAPITYSRQHETPATRTEGRCTYEKATGLLASRRSYFVEADPETCIGDLGDAPTTIEIPLDSVPITCDLVERQAARAGTGKSLVTLVYEGHRLGVMRWEGQTQTESTRRMVSLDDPPQGFGANNEGVIVNVPVTGLVVIGNASLAQVEEDGGLFAACSWLVGTVNQQGWSPNYRAEAGPELFNEGAYLFMLAQFTRNRDRTYTYKYQFETRFNLLNGKHYALHKEPWSHVRFDTVDVDGRQRLEIALVGDVRSPQKYPVAGEGFFSGFDWNDLGI